MDRNELAKKLPVFHSMGSDSTFLLVFPHRRNTREMNAILSDCAHEEMHMLHHVCLHCLLCLYLLAVWVSRLMRCCCCKSLEFAVWLDLVISWKLLQKGPHSSWHSMLMSVSLTYPVGITVTVLVSVAFHWRTHEICWWKYIYLKHKLPLSVQLNSSLLEWMEG